MLSIRLTFDWV